MKIRFAQALCRLFAAWVCFVCTYGTPLPGVALPEEATVREVAEQHATFYSAPHDLSSSGSPTEEKEEHDDDEDEQGGDLDDAFAPAWREHAGVPGVPGASFALGAHSSLLLPSHQSLDPRPPRRA